MNSPSAGEFGVPTAARSIAGAVWPRRVVEHRLAMLVAWVVGVVLACGLPGVARGEDVLRVVIAPKEPFPPLISYDEPDDRPAGFAIVVLESVARTLGARIEYVRIDSLEERREALRTGRVDIVPCIPVTAAAMNEFTLGDAFYTTSLAAFGGRDGAAVTQIRELAGKRVACVAGVATWLRTEMGSSAPQVVEAPSVEAALRMVVKGDVELAIADRVVGQYWVVREQLGTLRDMPLMDEMVAARPRSYGMGLRPGNLALRDRLNGALWTLRTSGEWSRLHIEHLSRYVPMDPGLTWMGRQRVTPLRLGDRTRASRLVVAVERAETSTPLFQRGKGGETTGFAAEVARAVGRELGMEVEVLALPNAEIRAGLSAGTIDVWSGAPIADQDLAQLDFSRPVLTSPGVLVVRRGSTFSASDVREKLIAVSGGSGSHQWLVSAGGQRILPMVSTDDAIEQVASGAADAAVTVEFAARMVIARERFTNLEVGPLPVRGFNRLWALGVRAGNKALLWDLEDGIRAIEASGTLTRMYDRWFAQVQPRPRPAVVDRRVIYWATGLIGGVGVLAGLWVWSLRRELGRRTRRLQAEQGKYRAIADNLPGLVFGCLVRDEGAREVLYVNNRLDEWRGRFPAFEPGMSPARAAAMVHADDRADFLARARRAGEGLERVSGEMRVIDGRGETRWVQYLVFPERTRDGVVWHVMLVDVTALRQATSALEQSERNYGAIFSSSLDAIVVVCPERHVVLAANNATSEVYGYAHDELIGMSVEQFVVNADRTRRVMGEVLQTGRVARVLGRHRRKDGSILSTEVNASRITFDGATAVLAVIRDISERERAEEERRELERKLETSRRLEGLGVLAGGIAHDFNNLLVGILGNAELALESRRDPERTQQLLSNVHLAARRAADLTQELLVSAGRTAIKAEPVDLGMLIAEVVAMLGPRVDPLARVELDAGEGMPVVRADATQLRQALMNLVSNASDALGGAAGVITIRTRVASLSRRELAGFQGGPELQEGAYASIEVSDTGRGMDAATLARAFEPFFTTKGAGHGLGLSVVLGVAQRHGGGLRIDSAPGEGTRVHLVLPMDASDVEAGASAGAGLGRGPIGTGLMGAGQVGAGQAGVALVVDDEPLVRQVAQSILEHAGWQVRAVEHGRAALAWLDGGEACDLVLLDLSMPGMSGHEVLGEIRRRRPGLRVVVMSGYDRMMSAGEAGARADAVVAKPFMVDELLAGIDAALSSGAMAK